MGNFYRLTAGLRDRTEESSTVNINITTTTNNNTNHATRGQKDILPNPFNR